ncbi:hypothetical protein ILYODFUR_035990 [Ilyodon furcidens]|uniref:Uncharacterized protein n=1 Tax=Ilyodon furcidens TaxID=33524 RepID=A0ABV0UPQ8_9TELE
MQLPSGRSDFPQILNASPKPELCMTKDHMTCRSQSHPVATCGIEGRPRRWRAGGDARFPRSVHRPSCAELRGPSMLLAALIVVVLSVNCSCTTLMKIFSHFSWSHDQLVNTSLFTSHVAF